MRHWIEAARIRTLPLSVWNNCRKYVCVSKSTDYILTLQSFNWRIFSFAIITTLGLQILSNFANDYGDGIKGRIGIELGQNRFGVITQKK
jgi:1,4-dihydroxy-2-naphthoate octaprenyltransferase